MISISGNGYDKTIGVNEYRDVVSAINYQNDWDKKKGII